MLTYLIILLDDTSTSYCHYEVTRTNQRLIGLDNLKAGILFAMKENLNVQFVYPSYVLPDDYNKVIESIDHIKIKPEGNAAFADVVVLKDWKKQEWDLFESTTYLIHCTRKDIVNERNTLKMLLEKVMRLDIVLTDVGSFSDADIAEYQETLNCLSDDIVELYQKGKKVQLNLLTDRLILPSMNNCNAGDSNVTLAPNGRFYLCPAFYYEDENNDIGDITTELKIRNPQLLRLDHAPLCRQCDAFQCKRCIWQNEKLTLDINTPSRQQCVMAHLERNASRKIVQQLAEKHIEIEGCQNIQEICYLDPFEVYTRWK